MGWRIFETEVFLILGVEQDGETLNPCGMREDDLNSFSQDDVSAVVNEYADPFVEVAVSKVSHEERGFVVIQKREFSEIPVICKKDGQRNIRRGAIYTRTRRIYETAEVPSQTEMREILDMAIEKRLRNYVSIATRAGLELRRPGEEDRRKLEEENSREFDEELGEL